MSTNCDFDVWQIEQGDNDYPAALRATKSPPATLYGIGNRAILSALEPSRAAAIVGSSHASNYGRDVAFSIAHDLAVQSVTVVSGMRLGLDGAAHRGALEAGGPTIAVVPSGPDVAHPKPHRLLRNLIAEHGCVLSEHPPGFKPHHADEINTQRIIAGLCGITVFTEGTNASLSYTATMFARQYESLVGAVPGPVTSPISRTPNDLIAGGRAIAIQSADDVTRALERAYPTS